MSTELAKEILQSICETCNIKDIDINSISLDAPLVGPESPLGIDSLDALEIVVMVEQTYGVRIGSQDTSRVVLQSLRTLTEHILRHTESLRN